MSGHTCTDGVVGPVFCPAVCIPGCQCDDGYILDSFGGQCITIEECQGTTTTTEGIDILSLCLHVIECIITLNKLL